MLFKRKKKLLKKTNSIEISTSFRLPSLELIINCAYSLCRRTDPLKWWSSPCDGNGGPLTTLLILLSQLVGLDKERWAWCCGLPQFGLSWGLTSDPSLRLNIFRPRNNINFPSCRPQESSSQRTIQVKPRWFFLESLYLVYHVGVFFIEPASFNWSKLVIFGILIVRLSSLFIRNRALRVVFIYKNSACVCLYWQSS